MNLGFNLTEEYERYKFQVERDAGKPNSHISKWKPVITSRGIINEFIIKELAIFLETYDRIEDNMPSFITNDPFSMPKYDIDPRTGQRVPVPQYPEDYIELYECLKLFKKDLDKYNINNSELKLNIVSEYYNAMNGKKGLLLDNGLRIEDGKFLDPDHQKKVDDKLKSIIDKRIDYILDKSKRKHLEREPKIKRILKED